MNFLVKIFTNLDGSLLEKTLAAYSFEGIREASLTSFFYSFIY
jgi:hypothetical protein